MTNKVQPSSNPFTVPPDFTNPFRGGMAHFHARKERAQQEGRLLMEQAQLEEMVPALASNHRSEVNICFSTPLFV